MTFQDEYECFDEDEYEPFLHTLEGEKGKKTKKTKKTKKKGKQKSKEPLSTVEACIRGIQQVAVKQRMTGGKWMVFAERDTVDDVWSSIAKLTAEGTLGTSAKVSPYRGQDGLVICVFVPDFMDRVDVGRVLWKLLTLPGSPCQNVCEPRFYIAPGFKPDVYTDLGIYAKNQWGIPPYIHEDLMRETLKRLKEQNTHVFGPDPNPSYRNNS